MRWSRALIFPVLLMLLVAACGGGSAASADGNGNQQSEEAEASASAESEPSDDGNGGPDGGDVEQLAEDLTPPNSTETSRTTAGGVVFVSYDSTDSPESLSEFYEDAIADTGLEVFSRTSTQGSFSWIFGVEDQGESGGVVTVVPGTDGGSTVAVQLGVNQ